MKYNNVHFLQFVANSWKKWGIKHTKAQIYRVFNTIEKGVLFGVGYIHSQCKWEGRYNYHQIQIIWPWKDRQHGEFTWKCIKSLWFASLFFPHFAVTTYIHDVYYLLYWKSGVPICSPKSCLPPPLKKYTIFFPQFIPRNFFPYITL